VIAHPDDEAMFFVPSIRRLREHNKLYLLCLGNGDGAGLGRIREKELIQSAKYLGF
jgi:N-acetylglucosaminylphosphatidylinositol deacetylase